MTEVVVWISESTWETCVEQAGTLLPPGADVTLLHVAPSDAEELAAGPGPGLLGRHPPRPPGPPVRQIAAEEADWLLRAAEAKLGRPAARVARRGHAEREVIEACADADLLVLARDGDARPGPKSLGPRTRFVVDHAPCQVLLLWSGEPPRADAVRLPPHLRR